MLGTVLRKVFGSQNDRELKRLQPLVDQINQRESSLTDLSLESLRAKTGELKQRLDQGAALDDLLPDAFAVVREISRRLLSMRHFDVQLIGGMVLHEGNIAEMKTGEGKTLAATLPVYLNSLTGKGVHVVTVNDYLARRDAEWMGPIYQALGLSVGSIQHDMDDVSRCEVYRADVTYGTNNEFGFDYLRDNMKFSREDFVQRPLHYAIVDEVDSILIDEARTPLIISGPAEESTDKYYRLDRVTPRLKPEVDYTVDEKSRSLALTDEGVVKAEQLLDVENLYDPINIETLHHLMQALKAHAMFKKDVDYVVKGGEVLIVDEFTGRLMPGRRYSDGLHQALEAKEHLKVANENQTLASITFQNYFRMYDKLAGMTGTADTEAAEFHQIYKLDVMVMPPNRTLVRTEHPDVIYRTEREKFHAVVEEIKELHQRGRPALVGTISIETSERLSAILKRQGIPHNILNAKNHEREAEIVAQAGRKGAATISTNMAGRGTDILLGGNPEFLARKACKLGTSDPDYPTQLEKAQTLCAAEHDEVVALGGLHIIGTERHEARRIDNQLRGRSGRQGDPGSSRFYLSLEDDLLRIFGSERISGVMEKLGMEEGQPIEHSMISKAIENAQRKVEAHNFDIRKHLLEYDDVMTKQREVLYRQRREVLETDDVHELVQDMHLEVFEDLFDTYIPAEAYADDWDLGGLTEAVKREYGVVLSLTPERVVALTRETLFEQIRHDLESHLTAKIQEVGAEQFQALARWVILHFIDKHWKDHLLAMDHLKEGIGLRGYGQKNPLNEYKREGFDMFVDMTERVKTDVVGVLFKAERITDEDELPHRQRSRSPRAIAHRGSLPGFPEDSGDATTVTTVRRLVDKVGRNAVCPCGSGKKYKICCG
ncbi:MAG: preprotein translocase subunit SecA, partial [Candidatus Tectomicrobia bacterium]